MGVTEERGGAKRSLTVHIRVVLHIRNIIHILCLPLISVSYGGDVALP